MSTFLLCELQTAVYFFFFKCSSLAPRKVLDSGSEEEKSKIFPLISSVAGYGLRKCKILSFIMCYVEVGVRPYVFVSWSVSSP